MARVTKLFNKWLLRGQSVLKTTDITISRKMLAGTVRDKPTPEESNCEGIKESQLHIPAMVNEAIDMLQPENNQIIVDMTFGAGGHTKEILKRAPGAKVFALDRDPLAYGLAKELAIVKSRRSHIVPLLGRFSELPGLLSAQGVAPGSVDGVLFDVGVSSMQFDMSERGFSLSKDGPLDMRMDGERNTSQLTAADVVNTLDPGELYTIIRRYGDEKQARQIAHAIVEAQYSQGYIGRTRQLADVVSSALSGNQRRDKLMRPAHVATKTFQALRIFVNDELNELNNGLEAARCYLRSGGRCVVISFHSLEDRIVKRHFHGIPMDNKSNMNVRDQFKSSTSIHSDVEPKEGTKKYWAPIRKKIISPDTDECVDNPRVRSSRLRGAIKL